MARAFDIDMRQFERAIRNAPEVILAGAKRGMHDVLDEWKAEAVDIAPIDKSTLRRSIKAGSIKRLRGLNLVGTITVNAVETYSGGRFNYGYYIHEKDAGGKRLRTSGTEKKFLDVALKRNEDEWKRQIENEIKTELRRRGW
jgi:hypothetical protein